MKAGDIFEIIEHHILDGRLIFDKSVTIVNSEIYEFDVEGTSFKTATFKKERFEELVEAGKIKKVEN